MILKEVPLRERISVLERAERDLACELEAAYGESSQVGLDVVHARSMHMWRSACCLLRGLIGVPLPFHVPCKRAVTGAQHKGSAFGSCFE